MAMLGFFNCQRNRMLILLAKKPFGGGHIEKMLEPAFKTRLNRLFQLWLRDNLCSICSRYHEPDAPPPPKPPPPPPKPPPPKPPRPLPPRPPPAIKACKISCASEVTNNKNTPAPIIKLAIQPMP